MINYGQINHVVDLNDWVENELRHGDTVRVFMKDEITALMNQDGKIYVLKCEPDTERVYNEVHS